MYLHIIATLHDTTERHSTHSLDFYDNRRRCFATAFAGCIMYTSGFIILDEYTSEDLRTKICLNTEKSNAAIVVTLRYVLRPVDKLNLSMDWLS